MLGECVNHPVDRWRPRKGILYCAQLARGRRRGSRLDLCLAFRAGRGGDCATDDVAWARREANGQVLAGIALTIAGITDALLIWATVNEGVEYFLRVKQMASVWIGLWISWQVLALIVVLFGKKTPAS